MAQVSIETHGGIEAITNFKLFVEPKITFVVKEKKFTSVFLCKEYKGHPSRQCYKCAFCHDVDLCSHMQCKIPCSDGAANMYKYKLVNMEIK